jgi:hypothetical protein
MCTIILKAINQNFISFLNNKSLHFSKEKNDTLNGVAYICPHKIKIAYSKEVSYKRDIMFSTFGFSLENNNINEIR